MDRLTWISYLLVLLSCIGAISNIHGDELSEGHELLNDETVKIQGDAAFPDSGAADNTKADVTFLVHVNKGTDKSKMERLVNFLKYLLYYADIDSGNIRVALAFYKLNVKVVFDFNAYTTKAEVENALDLFKESKARSPKANVAGALKSLPRVLLNEKKGDRPDARNYVILITDLESTIKKNLVSANADILKKTGAQILTVGVGLPDSAELRTIASPPPGLHSFFAGYDSLTSITSDIIRIVPPLYYQSDPVTTTPAPATRSTQPVRRVDPRTYTRCLNEKADLVFILDTSARVTETEFRTMLQFIKQIVNDLAVDSGNIRLGFLTSSAKVKVHFHLRRYQKKVDILNAINRITYLHGDTDTSEALKIPRIMFLPKKGDRPDVQNVAVLLTDARESIMSNKAILQAKRARDKFYKIIAVGIGFPGLQELNRISSDSLSFSTQDFRTLSTLLTPVAQAICSAAAPEAITRAPRPTQPEPRVTQPGFRCNSKADVVFLLDFSTSVRNKNFPKIIQFVEDFLSGANIDSGNIRVGILSFSDDAQIMFHLNKYNSAQGVKEGLRKIKYLYGGTNTANALNIMRTQMFREENGDRPDIPNIVFLVTDGVSTINKVRTIPEAEAARARNIHIYAIGIKLKSTIELESVASPPMQENVFTTDDFDGLQDIREHVFRKFCEDRVEVPTKIPVRTRAPPVVETVTQLPSTERPIRTRRPETPLPVPSRRPATPSPTESEGGQDIILMLDTSVDSSLFQWMIAFARAFTGQAAVNSGQMRIGLMVFSDEPIVEAQLNSYLNQADLLQAVDTLPHLKGKSDKSRAFRKVTTEMFTPRNGDRPRADNKIILLTGSQSIDSGRAMQEARFAKERTGAEVFVLGLNVSDAREPNSIGSLPTDEHVFLFKDPSVILRETATLLDKIQEEYVPPAPSPTTPRRTRPTRPPVTTRRTTPRPDTTTPRRRRPPTTTPRRRRPITTTTRRPTTTTTRRPTTTTTRRPTTTTPRRTTTPRIYLPSECTAKADIVFIVDSSGSVGDEDFRKVMDFVYRTIDSLDIKSGLYNIGLVTFSDQARIEFYLNSFSTKEEIENATASVQYIYGSTHTAMALRTARVNLFTEINGDRPDAPNLAIVITDGQSNINHEATLPQARMLKNSGATILTVAVGFATHTDELIGMTSQPVDENLFSVDHFSGLDDLHTKIVDPICKGRNHCAKNPCKNGALCYDTLRSYICICADGYFGVDCDKTCPQPADIAFVVDSSSSVGIISFNHMKSFVENLIRELEPEKCDHHIALMKYSSRPIVEFTLNRHSNMEAAIRAVNGMSYTTGYANMANAMKALRERIFNGQAGDRPTVKNIAYLLTDGQVDVARDETLSQAELTVSSGIHVVPIGFDLRNREEVDSIAASQGIKAVEIVPSSDVESLSESLLYAVFDNEDRCNPNPCSNGATCINQALSFKCECILGYSGETCEKRCESEADVVFVVDTSRYIPRRLLKQVKRMLRRTVKRLSFKSKNMRVGLVSFDSQARVRLDLDHGEIKRNVLAAISTLRSGKTNPNPGKALRLANQRIFDSKLGDRSNVPNYLVLVTKSARDLAMMVDQARNLKMKGTRIISIALTGTTASTASDLSEIVSLPVEKNKYLIPNNTEDHEIFDIIENLVEVVCYEKACLYSPCHNGGTCMPDYGTYVCQCPPGFAGRHCETECNQEADVIFLLDSSGSVSKDEFRKMKEFIISVSEKFSVGYSKTRIAAATYSSTAFLGFNLNAFNSASKLRNAMSSLPYIYGNTNTAAGLELVRTRMLHYKAGDRPQTQNFVIVLTNGKSNIDSESTIAEANLLKKHAHVYAVAIGTFDDKEIKEIASAPAALNAFAVPDYESLFEITDKVIGTICKTFNPCDESPCHNDAVCIPDITTYTCECRLGYAGKTCERRCNPNKDVAFILDASSSIGVENFKRILKFIGSLVNDLSHKNGKMRYSLITFSTKGTLVFSFGRFLDSKLIKEVIRQTSYTPGSTNIAAGLRNAADAFSTGYGSRPDADNFAIFITDGYSNVDAHLTIPTADDLKAKVKKVIGIGIGLDNTDELSAIASGETNVFVAENFLKLSEFETNVLAAICAGDEKEKDFYSVPREETEEPHKIDII